MAKAGGPLHRLQVFPPARMPAVFRARSAPRCAGLRNSLGLTLGEVARRANLSAGMLSRLENGGVSPSLETLATPTGALGVPLAQLFGDVGNRAAAQHVPRGQGLRSCAAAPSAVTRISCCADRGPRRLEPFLVHAQRQERSLSGLRAPRH